MRPKERFRPGRVDAEGPLRLSLTLLLIVPESAGHAAMDHICDIHGRIKDIQREEQRFSQGRNYYSRSNLILKFNLAFFLKRMSLRGWRP